MKILIAFSGVPLSIISGLYNAGMFPTFLFASALLGVWSKLSLYGGHLMGSIYCLATSGAALPFFGTPSYTSEQLLFYISLYSCLYLPLFSVCAFSSGTLMLPCSLHSCFYHHMCGARLSSRSLGLSLSFLPGL